MPRGRPASLVPLWECHIHLRLHAGEDDDIIAFLESLTPGRRVSDIKSTLRAGGMQGSFVTNDDLENELIFAATDFLK